MMRFSVVLQTRLAVSALGLMLVAVTPLGAQDPQEGADKLALAESVIAKEEAASERAFDPSFRAKARELLAALPLAELQSQAKGGGLGLNSLGDTQADLVYTPVTPCRIIDTRSAGGTLTPGVPRSFKVTGDTTSQGGANCGIPYGPATSAMINFVAVSPTGKGNMQITPYGQAMPTASFINFSNTAGTNLANGLAVALCNPAAATCTNDVTIQANVSGVDLVADVQGYFQRVTSGGVLALASGRTMKGNWSIGGLAATAAGEYVWTAFTFPLMLASAPASPNANFITGAPTANCPGTHANPQAAPGQLCVYATGCNANLECIFPGSLGNCTGTADLYGASIFLNSAGAGQVYCYGTWAVTAP